ncbi:hypothetical protein P9H32_05390 [Pontiella sp. NLcol2]|uniref:TonB-dependent receptor n=2 Tax=Pontiella agarivorans TaxID=3038953 RepID=A0ABU5MV08_9BACT|nr:hypothetical protein [Pontiella agarivorans]
MSIVSASAVSVLAQDGVNTRQAWQVLDTEPEVLVNAQGLAQRNLSIRGGSYTGSGLSINGLRLKSPYSAHWNAEFPILGNLLSVPTVGTGIDNASGHLVGTADFSTRPLGDARQVYAGLGTKEHYAGGIYASSENVGGYFDWEKARRIDSPENDLERSAGGAVFRIATEEWNIDLIAAGQSKDYGAYGYYGQTNDVSHLLDDTLLYAGATRGDTDDAFVRISAFYRDMRDQVLDVSTPDYTDIFSRNFAAAAEGRTMEIQHLALYVRGDLEYERVSGSIPDDDRTRGSLLFLPEARFERFTVKAGVNSVFQTAESTDFLPIAGIDWFLTDNGVVSLSYTETEQQPDFQTLENNPLLEQQHSKNTELGFKQYLSENSDWKIGAFFRTLENASDWIGGTATDLGRLNISGLDAAFSYYPNEQLRLSVYYQWVYKDNKIEDGLYETDYPEHLLNLSAYWHFLEQFSVQFSQTTRLQTENSVRTGDDFGALATLGLHYSPSFAQNARLSFLVDNLWGSNFQSIPGLKSRPTTVFTGLSVNW